MFENIADENGREIQAHGTQEFPCAAYGTKGTGFPWHWHEEFEMICVRSGRLIVAAGSERFHVRAGEAVMVNSGAPHMLMGDNGEWYEECDIVFHPRLLYGSRDSVLYETYIHPFLLNADLPGLRFCADRPGGETAAERIEAACALCTSRLPLYEFLVREELTRVFMDAWEGVCAELRPMTPAMRRAGERVKAVMRHLEQNLGKKMSVKELAELIHVSPRECQREFKAYLGITPHQYLSQSRLSQAAALLKNGNQSISELCQQCGFTDFSSFSRQFRDRYDMTPRQYRKKYGT